MLEPAASSSSVASDGMSLEATKLVETPVRKTQEKTEEPSAGDVTTAKPQRIGSREKVRRTTKPSEDVDTEHTIYERRKKRVRASSLQPSWKAQRRHVQLEVDKTQLMALPSEESLEPIAKTLPDSRQGSRASSPVNAKNEKNVVAETNVAQALGEWIEEQTTQMSRRQPVESSMSTQGSVRNQEILLPYQGLLAVARCGDSSPRRRKTKKMSLKVVQL